MTIPLLERSPSAVEPKYDLPTSRPRKPSLSVLVDIDDVLYPWYNTAHLLCQEAGLVPEGVEPRTWRPYEEYGITADQWWEALRVVTIDGRLYSAEPIEGAIAALWKIERAGHQINLVTARGSHSAIDDEARSCIRKATTTWLEAHHVPYDTLTFTANKGQVSADYGIDDHIRNYDELEAAGVAVWLIDRPWNQDDDGKQRRRVNTLSEFADIIIDMEAPA